MKILLLLTALALAIGFAVFHVVESSHEGSVHIPSEGDFLINIPEKVDGTDFVTITLDGHVSATALPQPRFEWTIPQEQARIVRERLIKHASRFMTRSKDISEVGGKGYSSVALDFGLGGEGVTVRWAWNLSKGVTAPGDALAVIEEMRQLIKARPSNAAVSSPLQKYP